MSFFIRHKKPGPLKPTANPYPSRFKRWRQSFGLIFIVILIMGVFVRCYKPFYETFRDELFEGTALSHGVFIFPFQKTRALLKKTQTFINLKEEHARLKEENEALKWQLQTLLPLQHENDVLRKSLKVTTFEKYTHLTAHILSSPYDGLHHFCLITAGKKHGLEKDQAVSAPEGIVGRLEKVGTYVSRVLLLNDSNSRIPVMTSTSEQKAILAGDGSPLPTLVYVADVRTIRQGEEVVTSGLGGIFPPGLPIGYVDEIKNGKIRVRPFVNFQNLEWVHILQIKKEGIFNELHSVLGGK